MAQVPSTVQVLLHLADFVAWLTWFVSIQHKASMDQGSAWLKILHRLGLLIV